MAFCEWKFLGDVAECGFCGRRVRTRSRTVRVHCDANHNTTLVSASVNYPKNGVGANLKTLLGRWPFYFEATESCPCNDHARQMDDWGPDECERRLESIIIWLQEEATRRQLPFSRWAAQMLVRHAIAKARHATPCRSGAD